VGSGTTQGSSLHAKGYASVPDTPREHSLRFRGTRRFNALFFRFVPFALPSLSLPPSPSLPRGGENTRAPRRRRLICPAMLCYCPPCPCCQASRVRDDEGGQGFIRSGSSRSLELFPCRWAGICRQTSSCACSSVSVPGTNQSTRCNRAISSSSYDAMAASLSCQLPCCVPGQIARSIYAARVETMPYSSTMQEGSISDRGTWAKVRCCGGWRREQS
jgi:hypothetical protein